MSTTLEYLRPQTLDEALRLLQRPGLRTLPLAGGVWLTPRLRRDVQVPQPLSEPADAVVDLADLGLDGIELDGEPGDGWLRIGATTTLSAIVEDAACRQFTGDGLLVDAARRAAPLNQRNAATLAGTLLGADSASELLLTLLALDTRVTVTTGTPRTLHLAELVSGPTHELAHGLVLRFDVPWPGQDTRSAAARVARTPADQPIVAAVAVAQRTRRRIALGGVTEQPLLLDVTETPLDAALTAALAEVELRSDWLGSAEYRREMAAVLTERVLAEVNG